MHYLESIELVFSLNYQTFKMCQLQRWISPVLPKAGPRALCGLDRGHFLFSCTVIWEASVELLVLVFCQLSALFFPFWCPIECSLSGCKTQMCEYAYNFYIYKKKYHGTQIWDQYSKRAQQKWLKLLVVIVDVDTWRWVFVLLLLFYTVAKF